MVNFFWPGRCTGLSSHAPFGAHLQNGYHAPWWTAEERARLGTIPDEEVAAQIGRTASAVRRKRTKRGIATAQGTGDGGRAGEP